MIERSIHSEITSKLNTGKALVIFGARQTGKTTLLNTIFKETQNVLWLNGDDEDTHSIFSSTSAAQLQTYFAGYKTLIIDEAQRIDNVGIKLKLITDQMPQLQLVATGSSSFDLANKVNEPLTGRKWEFQLFPLSFQEMVNHHGLLAEKRLLHHRLLFGYYPEVISAESNHKEILKQLSDSFLFKDILLWENIKKSDKLIAVLKALAYQIGSEVSFNEIGKTIGLDNQTVEKYIQLLEQTFVIFRLPAFSRNHRKELKKSRKIYFYDTGIRNALITDFRPVASRNDIGALWENFLVSERMKHNAYNHRWANTYFWRTHDQQEVDYIEDMDGVLYAFEFKWSPIKKARLPKTFSNTYPHNQFKVVTPENFLGFVTDGAAL